MTEVALGVDIGTGSTKAALVDPAGRVVALGRSTHPIEEPRPGWSETDPSAWLDSTRSAVAEALAAAGGSSTVVSVGLSGQMHGVVLCDAAGRPVRPAVLWSDRRAQPLLDRLRAAVPADELARLANPLVAGMAGPIVAALAADGPAALAGVATILQPKDWVRHRLVGAVATDPSDASATLLWDAVGDRWSEAACRAFGVDPAWLPPVAGSDAVAGEVSGPGAEWSGVPAGVPVAVGGADTPCALLGAGLAPGELQVSTGTGGQLARLTRRGPVPVARPVTHHYRSVADAGGSSASWYEMAAIQNAGVAIDWALGLLGVPVDEAGPLVAGTPVGAGGVTFLPYLTGERTPHLDTGLVGGWVGLRSSTTRAELVRSVFEGVAFALADGLEALDDGSRPRSALLAGGGSTAPWWRQLLADALDLILVPHDAADASARGAALLAWSALGSPVDAAAAVHRLDPVTPDPRAAAGVAEARARFRAALPAARAAKPATPGPAGQDSTAWISPTA